MFLGSTLYINIILWKSVFLHISIYKSVSVRE